MNARREMSEPNPNVLVVDDEQPQLDTVCRGLRLYGYRCVGVLSVDAAIDALAHESFDLVLTDLTMPGRTGLALIEHVERHHPGLPIVVVTGLAATHELDVVRTRDLPVLAKPFGPDDLDVTLRRALGRS